MNGRMRTLMQYGVSILNRNGVLKGLSDEQLIRLRWKTRFDYPLNLDNPQTFMEKLQWLKLHDRKPKYTQMVDKYAAKQYVADQIGQEHIIPTLGVWNKFDDIDFDALPTQFVLKCTHDSSGLVICKDKSKLDYARARRKFCRSLKRDFYLSGREWPYKNVQRRIIAEKYMEDESGGLKDYKIFCFHGEPRIVMTVTGGHGNEALTQRRMYDPQWNLIPVGIHGKQPQTQAEPKPEKLEQMLAIARKLSADMRHLRVDLYCIHGHIYFGELTFYHQSGFETFTPESYDTLFGSWLDLN